MLRVIRTLVIIIVITESALTTGVTLVMALVCILSVVGTLARPLGYDVYGGSDDDCGDYHDYTERARS